MYGDPPLHYKLLRSIVGWLLRVLARLEVEGLENVPPNGPLLVVTNHIHWLDPVVAFAILPHQAVVFAADKWARRPPIGCLMRWVGDAIFVARGEVDRRALGQALRVLKEGKVLGIAPEGTRSKTGGLQRGRGGAAYLASRTGVTLLPLVAFGQEKAERSWLRLRRPLIKVVIGEPFTLPGTPNRAKGEEMDRYTDEIMQRIAALLPPEYRGVYA